MSIWSTPHTQTSTVLSHSSRRGCMLCVSCVCVYRNTYRNTLNATPTSIQQGWAADQSVSFSPLWRTVVWMRSPLWPPPSTTHFPSNGRIVSLYVQPHCCEFDIVSTNFEVIFTFVCVVSQFCASQQVRRIESYPFIHLFECLSVESVAESAKTRQK